MDTVVLAVSGTDWLVIGPALLAAAIGLTSALLSYRSSKAALERSSADAAAERAHRQAMLVFDRRLLAIEAIWQRIFEIERSGELSGRARDEIVRAVVWLPEKTRYDVLSAVNRHQEGLDVSEVFPAVRETLEALTRKYEEEKA